MPRDDDDDVVSIEVPPSAWPVPLVGLGSGGTASAGASNPFFIVGVPFEDDDRFIEKRPLAFGADATRRMNLLADAPTAFGESGGRDGECCDALNDCCDWNDA